MYELDCNLSRRKGVRYMDDLLILARTRWQLRRAVSEMNRRLEHACLSQHPDKTFIGRVDTGFDWLGYRFGAKGVCGIAAASVHRFMEKLWRLYEQAAAGNASEEARRQRLSEYIHRWAGSRVLAF